MENTIITKLHKTAEEFGKIAHNINNSSKKRKQHSEKALEHIHQSLDIGGKLDKDFDDVARSNIKLRDQDTYVLNTCLNLKVTINTQKNLIQALEKKNKIPADIKEEINKIIHDFDKSLDEAIDSAKNIIESDNNIVLMDKLLIVRKKAQQESIKKLHKLAAISLEDAEKAISGSSSNLDRGLVMVESFKNVKDLVDGKDREALEDLKNEANKGWNIAVKVNTSSKSQFEFAEQVNQFTEELHNDSITIRDLVEKKHHIFEQNLQTITVLTVNISLGFKNYLAMETILKGLEIDPENLETYNSLNAHIEITCRDIRDISALNYDMTDSIHLNNEIETKAFKLSQEELQHYDAIRQEVKTMTEATRYPVEGSGKNIENGKILEEEIKKLINSL